MGTFDKEKREQIGENRQKHQVKGDRNRRVQGFGNNGVQEYGKRLVQFCVESEVQGW